MKLADITAWLASSQDFAQGRALYAALGTNRTYQRLFGLGATAYSRGVLVRELRALVEVVPVALAVVTAPAPAAPVLAPPPPRVELSPLLFDLRQQLRQLRDERSHLHPQLTGKGVGRTARGALALRIVEITSQEVQVKALEAHVLQHGRLPGPVATADVTDSGELRQRLLNLRSRRSKLKTKTDQAEKLAEVEAEILLIQSKITT